MMKYFLKTLPALILWGSFILVVLRVPYPESLTQANFTQIFPFFISLYLALIFTFNIILKNILFSASICLGIILLLLLKSLDSLNIVTGILIAVATYFLASYFKKAKKYRLTKESKITKLTKQL